MKKIIIYTGLSISFDEAKSILDSDKEHEIIYERPIQRGDLIKAIKQEPEIIGIIDGVFHQAPAVGHKEILDALNKNITVIGSSSMGALRASELDKLGMKGIGYVYNEYATGSITSDDDVAVILDPETLEALSVPLVNMQYSFSKAVEKRIISENEKEKLLEIAKEIYYPERNYSIVLNKSNLDDDKKEKLMSFVNSSEDIKKEDAKELLKYIKTLIS